MKEEVARVKGAPHLVAQDVGGVLPVVPERVGDFQRAGPGGGGRARRERRAAAANAAPGGALAEVIRPLLQLPAAIAAARCTPHRLYGTVFLC